MKSRKVFIVTTLLTIGMLGLSVSSCNIQGPQGEQGVEGPKGDNGKDGIDGKDGTSIIRGNEAPLNDLVNVGDSYINIDTWDYYVKYSTGWIKKGNIKGETGNDGKPGIDGIDGADGTNGEDGTSILTGQGIPSNELGKTGDSYIDTDTWSFYVKEKYGWTLKGNIKGDAGSEGKPGLDGTNGNDGKDGQTPFIGDNGNWWIGNKDTGISVTPTTYIPAIFKIMMEQLYIHFSMKKEATLFIMGLLQLDKAIMMAKKNYHILSLVGINL